METVGAYDAKTHLPSLLDRVAEGEQIIIARHGVPVARLVPADETGVKRPIDEIIAELREFRKGRSLSVEAIKESIHEGHRW